MTAWIIKCASLTPDDTTSYEYLSGPGEGSAWGPKLRDAYRFKSRSAAWREVGRLEQEHKKAVERGDWKFTVRRVRSVKERLQSQNRLLHYALTNATCILVQYIGEEHGVIKLAREALASLRQCKESGGNDG